jgi:prophage endopeptidase
MIALWAKAALKWLAGLPWQVWAAIALCVALLALRWHWIGVGEDRIQAQWDEAEAGHRAAAAVHAAEVAATESRWRADFDAAVSRLTQENADALVERDGLIADLRAGTARLRDKFRCPSGGVPGSAGAGPGTDDAADAYLSESDQEFLVRIGAEADDVVRQLTACQATLRSLQ